MVVRRFSAKGATTSLGPLPKEPVSKSAEGLNLYPGYYIAGLSDGMGGIGG